MTQTLLDMLIQDNSSVKAEYLNKFNLGLHQFYLSLAYELHLRRSVIQYPKLEFNDPVSLPNATAFGKPDLCFYNVQVYGFPGFRKWSQRLETEQGDPYLQYYKVSRFFSLVFVEIIVLSWKKKGEGRVRNVEIFWFRDWTQFKVILFLILDSNIWKKSKAICIFNFFICQLECLMALLVQQK